MMKKYLGTGCIILSVLLLVACARPARTDSTAQAEPTAPKTTAEPAATEPPETEKPEIVESATPTATIQPTATVEPTPYTIPIPEGIEEPRRFFPEHRQKNYTVIAKSGLVVRNQPNPDGEKLDTLKTDTVVQVIAPYGDLWVLVRYDGNYGWVNGNYLRGEQRPKPDGVTITEEEAKTFFDTYVCPETESIEIFDGMETVLTQHPEMTFDGYGYDGIKKILSAKGQWTENDGYQIVINRAELQKLLGSVYGDNRMDAGDWGEPEGDNIVATEVDGVGDLGQIYTKLKGISVNGSLATIQMKSATKQWGIFDNAGRLSQGLQEESKVEFAGPNWVLPEDWTGDINTFDDLCREYELNEEDFGFINVVLFKDADGVHLWGTFPEAQVNYPW